MLPPRKRLAVQRALEIKGDPVFLACSPVDFLPLHPLPAQFPDHVIDIPARDLGLRHRDLEGAGIRQLDIRKDLEGRDEFQVLAIFEVHRLDMRRAGRAQLFLVDGLAVARMHGVGQDLIACLLPEPLAYHLQRHLARAKPGNLDLPGHALQFLLECGPDRLARHLDRHPAPQFSCCLQRYLHQPDPLFKHL